MPKEDVPAKSNPAKLIAFSIPVALACVIGYAMTHGASLAKVIPVLLILALALSVAAYFLKRDRGGRR